MKFSTSALRSSSNSRICSIIAGAGQTGSVGAAAHDQIHRQGQGLQRGIGCHRPQRQFQRLAPLAVEAWAQIG